MSEARQKNRSWRGGLLLFMLGLVPGSAQAAPNGLTQIPIAKVFGDGVGSFSVARSQQSSDTTVYTTQYGIRNWLEAGLDYQAAPANQQTVLGNVKVLLLHQPRQRPDIAAGLQNLAPHQKTLPYLVVTTAPRAIGYSLGVTRTSSGGYQLMGGLSYSLNPNFQFVFDGITGGESYRTLGCIANVSKNLTLNLAYTRPNELKQNPAGFVVNLAYTLHIKGGKTQGGAPEKNPAPAGGGAPARG
jgi:hypothetical protein